MRGNEEGEGWWLKERLQLFDSLVKAGALYGFGDRKGGRKLKDYTDNW